MAAATSRPVTSDGAWSCRGLPRDALIEFAVRRRLGLSAEWVLPGIRLSHRGGSRAGARRGGDVGSLRCARMSRTAGVSVMKAMMRISTPHRGE
jgi:hypothetical protein